MTRYYVRRHDSTLRRHVYLGRGGYWTLDRDAAMNWGSFAGAYSSRRSYLCEATARIVRVGRRPRSRVPLLVEPRYFLRVPGTPALYAAPWGLWTPYRDAVVYYRHRDAALIALGEVRRTHPTARLVRVAPRGLR